MCLNYYSTSFAFSIPINFTIFQLFELNTKFTCVTKNNNINKVSYVGPLIILVNINLPYNIEKSLLQLLIFCNILGP